MPAGIPIDGKVLRRLREDRMWSQKDLADRAREFAAAEGDRHCAVNKNMVTKYETGASPRIGRRNLRCLVGALRPTLEELHHLLASEPPKPLADLTVDFEEDKTKRRDALKLSLTAVGQLLLPRTSRHALTPIEKLTAITQGHRRLDPHLPSWQLLEPVTNHLRFLDDLYGDTPESAYRRDLAAAVSEAAGFAAWLSLDIDDAAQAQGHYRHAIHAATAAGDPMLSGYMLGSMSWLAVQLGDGASASRLIDGAKAKIGPIGTGTPATSAAWLAVHEALAQAAQGDTLRSLRLLEQAAEASARAANEEPVWPWLYPFTSDKLAAFTGSCHLRLGRARDARAALDEALALRPGVTRERASLLLDLADAELGGQRPELDRVGELLAEASTIAAAKGSARVWRQVSDSRARLDPWSSSRAVRVLDDHLRSLAN